MKGESSKYKHYEDKRTDNEVDLTNVLVHAVSDYNLQLHQPNDYLCTHANKDILTIAINGVPANKREFEGFIWTKKFINYFPPCFQLDQTQEFYAKRIYDATLETVVKEIDDIVIANGNRVVFVSHSNGCYMSTAYIHYHPQKVVGIIEFGCIPATFYTGLKIFGEQYVFGEGDLKAQTLLKKKEAIYKDYSKISVHVEQAIKNPYTLIAFYSILNAEVFKEVFAWRRSYPDILKLIIFGRNDAIFQQDLLNEVAYHYAYGAGKLSESCNKAMSNKYKAITNFETTNVQERFVYSFPKAGHGLHINRKKPLRNLMNLYLGLVLSDFTQAASL